MKVIHLSKDMATFVDDEDYEALSQFKWYASNNGCGHFYAARSDSRKKLVRMHRLIMGAPKGAQVDHINGNTLDNCKSNLRLATNGQNQMNSYRTKSASGYKGVTRRGSRYKGTIILNAKQMHLGTFDTAKAAALAYNKAALVHFGEFARINEIKD